MSDWGWVALGFVAVYGLLASYVAWTAWRVRKAAEQLRRLT